MQLAIAFGTTKFHEYVYGRPIPKPMEDITKKPMEAIAKKQINNTPNARKECYYSFKAMISRLLTKDVLCGHAVSGAITEQNQERSSTAASRSSQCAHGIRSPFAQESSTALADLESKDSRNPSGHRPE